ncbi:carboxymuconolactone decarboxylase family protein [bacterium]
MSNDLKEFQMYREKMNAKILESENLEIKRFFSLDSAVYRDGALPVKTKELLGLVASTVLRCNDCILYHINQCRQAGVASEEFHEVMSVALIVGGSITIPHLRYAYEMWEKVLEDGS